MKQLSLLLKKLFLFPISLTCLTIYAQQKQANDNTVKQTRSYTYRIISTANNTYGYDIYGNDKLLIHQPTIPALPGNEGFKTSDAAVKVAALVIKKIKKGEMPPAVSIEEMKKLNAF